MNKYLLFALCFIAYSHIFNCNPIVDSQSPQSNVDTNGPTSTKPLVPYYTLGIKIISPEYQLKYHSGDTMLMYFYFGPELNNEAGILSLKDSENKEIYSFKSIQISKLISNDSIYLGTTVSPRPENSGNFYRNEWIIPDSLECINCQLYLTIKNKDLADSVELEITNGLK